MSQIKWSVEDVANVLMHISNMAGDLTIRKESLEDLTNYWQIMDLSTNSPKNISYVLT